MDFVELKCKNCGSPIRYQTGATHIKCGYCGTEYVLAPAARRQAYEPIRQIDYMGRGALFQSFVPQGWSARVIPDDDSASFSAAVCRGLRLDSPEGARLIFYPFAYFKSFSPGPLGLRKDYALDPAAGIRYRRRTGMEQYARERLTELFGGLDGLRLSSAEDKDAVLSRRAGAFIPEAAKVIKGKLTGDWARSDLSFSVNGAAYSGCLGIGWVYSEEVAGEAQPEPRQPQRPAGSGGFLEKAMNYRGIFGGPSLNDIKNGVGGGLGNLGGGLSAMFAAADWARVCEFILSGRHADGE